MRKIIIVFGILVAGILVITPSVPAVHYTVAMDSTTSKIIKELKTFDLQSLKQKLDQTNPHILKEKLKTIEWNFNLLSLILAMILTVPLLFTMALGSMKFALPALLDFGIIGIGAFIYVLLASLLSG